MAKIHTIICVLGLMCLVAPATGSLLNRFLYSIMKDVLEEYSQDDAAFHPQDVNPAKDEATYHVAVEKRASTKKVKWFKGKTCKHPFDKDYCHRYYKNRISKAPNGDDFKFEELNTNTMAYGCLFKTTKGSNKKVLSVAFNEAKSKVKCGTNDDNLEYDYCGCWTYPKKIQWYKSNTCDFPFPKTYCKKYAEYRGLTMIEKKSKGNPNGCLIKNDKKNAVEVVYNQNAQSTENCGSGDYPYCVCFTQKEFVKS